MNIEYGFTVLNVNIPYFVPIFLNSFLLFHGAGRS